MHIVGLDIGGANLKAADCDGNAVTRPFAIWRFPEQLTAELERLLQDFARPEALAVTMTAELADCFQTKRQGVDAILSAIERVARSVPIAVWRTDGEFVSPQAAREAPLLAAASNWHALATFGGRLAPDGAALLVDVGSTTTDLIALGGGSPAPIGRTDRERLQSGELVYTGVRRTPVCAIVASVPFRGTDCPLAAEFFATTLDAYLTLGEIPEDAHDRETANGRPATLPDARDRLARCLCCDASEFTPDDAVVLSRAVAEAQRRRLADAIDRVLASHGNGPNRLLIAGSGSFLARHTIAAHERLMDVETVDLARLLGSRVSAAACAYAVAQLAADRRPF